MPKPDASRQQEVSRKRKLELQPEDRSDEDLEEAMPRAPAQQGKKGTQRQTKHETAARAKPDLAVEEHGHSRDEQDDLPATYNNMPLKKKPSHKPQQKQASAQLEDDASDSSQPATSGPAQQHRDHIDAEKKTKQAGKGSALDYTADSESEPDDYIPTQHRAAAAKAASKAAGKKAAAVKAEPKGKAKQPKQQKVH